MRSRVRKTKDNKLSTQQMCSSNPGKCGNKWVRERFIEKITTYPNEAIHDDCVVAFTGDYEKIVSEVQTQRVNVDKWYST
ncbi:hypothetical protein [Methanobrevibacter sp.]